MRDDPTMKWLVAARNQIEKEGDLDTFSTLRIQILSSYAEAPVEEFDADPLLPSSAVPNLLSSHDLPADVRRDGVMILERRWIVKELPNSELLDALAHAYGLLAQIVSSAHVQIGLPPVEAFQKTVSGRLAPVPLSDEELRGRLPCMLDAEHFRTVHVKLSTGDVGVVRKQRAAETPIDAEAIVRHYRFDRNRIAGKSPKTLAEQLDAWLEIAMSVLRKDGYHEQTVLLRSTDTMKVVQFRSEDRADKYLNAKLLADEVRSSGADSVIVIGEAWIAPFDPLYPGRPAADSPGRLEVLSVDGITRAGEEDSVIVEIYREGSDIRFGTPTHNRGHSHYLDPVRRVWDEPC